MRELPRGTVTFLFTDVEGSTKLLRDVGAKQYAEILGEHHRLLRDAFGRHEGHEVGSQGDGFLAVFGSATDAVAAAVGAQRALAEHQWPEKREPHVRMGCTAASRWPLRRAMPESTSIGAPGSQRPPTRQPRDGA